MRNKQNKVLLSYQTGDCNINVTQWSNSEWHVTCYYSGGRSSVPREFESLAAAEGYAAREFKVRLEEEEAIKSMGIN